MSGRKDRLRSRQHFSSSDSWWEEEWVLKKSCDFGRECERNCCNSVYMSKRSADALVHRHSRRLADYDGTTRPFRVAVLLLSH